MVFMWLITSDHSLQSGVVFTGAPCALLFLVYQVYKHIVNWHWVWSLLALHWVPWLFILSFRIWFCYWFLFVWHLWWSQSIPFIPFYCLLCYYFVCFLKVLFNIRRIIGQNTGIGPRPLLLKLVHRPEFGVLSRPASIFTWYSLLCLPCVQISLFL